MSEDLDFTSPEDQPKYLDKPGVYQLEVLTYLYSQDIEGYAKTPFVRFNTKDTASQLLTGFVLWMPTAKDSPARSDLKKKLLKEFLGNLGCQMGVLKGKDLLDCSIGKTCKVALRGKERVIYRKSDKKPIVVSDLDYYYSGTNDKPLTANESKMFSLLPADRRIKYNEELKTWEEANGIKSKSTQGATNIINQSFQGQTSGSQSTDGSTDEDEWPF